MKAWMSIVLAITGYVLSFSVGPISAQEQSAPADTMKIYTFEKDIAPIVGKYCMSCHGSDTMNKSDLYMDDYQTLMKGGKHGVPVVPGKPDKSLMYRKLLPDPPFGKQMPRGHKKITPEAVQIIHDWIAEGAKEK